MRRHTCLLILTSALAMPVQADMLGFTVDAGIWNMDSSGSLSDTTKDEMQDFELGSRGTGVFSLAFEHPIPVIPNFMLRTNDLSAEDSTRLSRRFTYDGVDYVANSEVNVELNLTSSDFVFYYEVFDNDLVSFDFGLNLKYLDGDIRVDSKESNLSSQDHFKGYVPMLYGAAQVGIPTTRFSIYGDLNVLSIGDHTLQDYQAGVAFGLIETPPLDIRLKGGYRRFSLELDDLDGVYTDWSFDGLYLGVQADF
ncbi:MAG: TIGR04219 family outer membrane beta-barrel protein [Candidatus Thiodiazotropha sp.]|jgi:outer membrane protein